MSEVLSLQIVDSILKEFRSRNGVPAIGAAIVHSSGEAISHVVGVRRRDLPEQVSVSDKWYIGSCAKSISAALWARLVELGLAEWDTPLPQIFEGLRSVDERWTDVTILHALQCRAGFPANPPREVFKSSWEDTRPLPEPRADIVERSLQRPPSRPGKFRYSNLSYIVVGAAIERVAQTSFEEALELYLLQPLGVRTAGFGAPEEICGHQARVTFGSVGLFKGPPTRPDEFDVCLRKPRRSVWEINQLVAGCGVRGCGWFDGSRCGLGGRGRGRRCGLGGWRRRGRGVRRRG